MIKNCTKFALTVGIGLSLVSGLSHTAFEKENDTALVITNPSAPARLGALALIHDDEGFSVLNKSEIRRIPSHLVTRDLRGISQDEVKARLDDNIAFRVQQGSDGEFSLQECGGLEGGGPITGAACYWTVKSLGYVGLGAFVVGAGIVGAITSRPSHSAPGADHSVKHGNALSILATAIIAKTGAIAAIETASAAAGAAGTASPLP